MKLKVNEQYNCGNGRFIIPRSRFAEGPEPKYAVIELRSFDDNGHYTMQHITMTRSQIREALKMKKREALEII